MAGNLAREPAGARFHRQRRRARPHRHAPVSFQARPETIDHIASMNSMGRLGTPEDIAEAVAFLAGPARWVNGQVLYANGGAA